MTLLYGLFGSKEEKEEILIRYLMNSMVQGRGRKGKRDFD